MNLVMKEILHLLIDRAAGLLQHERDQLHARLSEAYQASQAPPPEPGKPAEPEQPPAPVQITQGSPL